MAGQQAHGYQPVPGFEIPVRSPAGGEWFFEVRVFDDGVGFRYRVPGAGTRRVAGEPTRWHLPTDSTVWFQTDTTNYEGAYQSTRADQVPREQEAKKRPVHLGLPMTVGFADGGFGLITEAALYNYSGLTPRGRKTARGSGRPLRMIRAVGRTKDRCYRPGG